MRNPACLLLPPLALALMACPADPEAAEAEAGTAFLGGREKEFEGVVF